MQFFHSVRLYFLFMYLVPNAEAFITFQLSGKKWVNEKQKNKSLKDCVTRFNTGCFLCLLMSEEPLLFHMVKVQNFKEVLKVVSNGTGGGV